MKKPAPIKVKGPGDLKVECIGYGDQKSVPYVWIGSAEHGSCYGYVHANSLRKLKAWVDACIEASKKVKD